MEPVQKPESTPRRSIRLQKQRVATPDIPLGPRAYMKLNKSKLNLSQNMTNKTQVSITISEATPPKNNPIRTSIASESQKRKRKSKMSEALKSENQESDEIMTNDLKGSEIEKSEPDMKEPEREKKSEPDMKESEIEKKSEPNMKKQEDEKSEPDMKDREIEKVESGMKEEEIEKVESGSENKDDKRTEIIPELVAAVLDLPLNAEASSLTTIVASSSSANITAPIVETSTDNNSNTQKTLEEETTVIEKVEPFKTKIKEEEKEVMNTTPQLMDESIISVPDSPPSMMAVSVAPIKDSTFSPEVDSSIHDSRPHIDYVPNLNLTPIPIRSDKIRTSTPLAQRILKRETPKLSSPVLSTLAKVLSPNLDVRGKLNEESLSETLNGQFKMGNLLERSILKSSRRKRSMSVADGESFIQKKVAFMSPKIVEIDDIDMKMLKSFREEKELSILKQNVMSGTRRKRSLSVADSPVVAKKKMIPNFKKIHEQQFKRMESIYDHHQRKTERAKRLATPTKVLPAIADNVDVKKHENASKIPVVTRRMPLTKVPSMENINAAKPKVKRTLSVDLPIKASAKMIEKKKDEVKKNAVVSALPKYIPSANGKGSSMKFSFGVSKPTSTVSASLTASSSSSQILRNKVEDRREKNQSLYKGNAVKTGLDHRKKNEIVLKGVRLNRRFELAMKHRQDIDNNTED